MQTATVNVGRLWASFKQMLTSATRRISHRWFVLLSQLMFFRFNYRHFQANAMPAWTDQDSLLADRMERFHDAFQRLSKMDQANEYLDISLLDWRFN